MAENFRHRGNTGAVYDTEVGKKKRERMRARRRKQRLRMLMMGIMCVVFAIMFMMEKSLLKNYLMIIFALFVKNLNQCL